MNEEKMFDSLLEKQEDSVKLIKYSRGFGWEIKIHGKDMSKIVSAIDEVNKELKKITDEE
jgi:transketolase N-terminal domain/subunit